MRLPEFVTEISPVRETLEAVAKGENALTAEVEEAAKQFYVPTATRGLTLWEADYSLENQGEDEARRAAIWTALAGGRTLTPEYLEELCVSLGKGDWGQVNEDFCNWTITAYSAAFGRIPGGAEALDAAVRRLKPAHLAVEVHPTGVFFPKTDRASAAAGGAAMEVSGGDALQSRLDHSMAMHGDMALELFGNDTLSGPTVHSSALSGGMCWEAFGTDALRGEARRGVVLTGDICVIYT